MLDRLVNVVPYIIKLTLGGFKITSANPRWLRLPHALRRLMRHLLLGGSTRLLPAALSAIRSNLGDVEASIVDVTTAFLMNSSNSNAFSLPKCSAESSIL